MKIGVGSRTTKSLRGVAFLLAVLTALLPLGSCSKQQTVHVILAESTLSASDALPFIAEEKGYWMEEGLDVQVLGFPAGKPAFDAMLSGQAHFAFAGETPAALAAFNQNSYCVLAEVATSTHELALIARRDQGIASVADLNGKKVAIMRGTQSDYFLYRSLLAAGVAADTVSKVSIQPPEMARAVVSHDVDAISIWQPHATRALNQLGAGGMSLKTDGAYEGIVSLMTLRSYASQNPEVVRRLLQGLIKAEAFAKAHPEEARAIVAKQIKLDPALLASFYSDYDFSVKIEPKLLEELQDEGEWAKKTSLVTADKLMPDYSEYVFSEPLRGIEASRVTSGGAR